MRVVRSFASSGSSSWAGPGRADDDVEVSQLPGPGTGDGDDVATSILRVAAAHEHRA